MVLILGHYVLVRTWTLEIDGNRNVEVLYKKEVPLQQNSQFHIYINSKMNAAGLRPSIFFLRDKSGRILGDKCLLQYHIEENCQSVEFDVKPQNWKQEKREKAILPHAEKHNGSNETRTIQ